MLLRLPVNNSLKRIDAPSPNTALNDPEKNKNTDQINLLNVLFELRRIKAQTLAYVIGKIGIGAYPENLKAKPDAISENRE